VRILNSTVFGNSVQSGGATGDGMHSRTGSIGALHFTTLFASNRTPVSRLTTYTVSTRDGGHSITCAITAAGAYGHAQATSGPVQVPAIVKLSQVSQARSTWAETKTKNGPPVGTTFRYTLNTPGTVKLTFTRQKARRSVGRLKGPGKIGKDALRFKGRVGRHTWRCEDTGRGAVAPRAGRSDGGAGRCVLHRGYPSRVLEDRRRTKGAYLWLSLEGSDATGRVRSANLDVVRAIAALFVLAAHAKLLLTAGGPPYAHPGFNTMQSIGANGVWLFFALSGFLISAPFVRALLHGTPLPAPLPYAVRRCARILPAYWIPLAVIFVVVPGVAMVRWWEVPLHGLLLNGFVPGQMFRFYDVAWTLVAEASFYAFVPIAATVVRRRRGASPIPTGTLAGGILALWGLSLAGVVASSFVFAGGTSDIAPMFFNGLVGTLGNFCPGMLVYLAIASPDGAGGTCSAIYRGVARHPRTALSAAVGLMAASGFALQSSSYVIFSLAREPAAIAASLMLVGSTADFVWIRRMARLLAPIGLISYGIYLWHWVIALLLRKYDTPLAPFSGSSWLKQTALLIALTVPAALASWILIERPLLRRTARWDQRRRKPFVDPRLPAAQPATE
jgi:peptidoglycan/LPS O-acetylase OafA/YrhL